MKRLLFTFAFLSACVSAPRKVVVEGLNGYNYHSTHYKARCLVAGPPPPCTAYYDDLRAFKPELEQLANAIYLGQGSAPLQRAAVKARLDRLKKDEVALP